MIVDGLGLCLRCADDEPCCFETAKVPLETRRFEDDPSAIFAVWPSVGKVARRGAEVDLECDPDIKRAAVGDLECMNITAVARKYSLRLRMVKAWNEDRIREAELRGEDPRAAERERCREAYRVRALAHRPVKATIGGETVLIAPAATMGTEALNGQVRPRKNFKGWRANGKNYPLTESA
jgi:hypothetical protein